MTRLNLAVATLEPLGDCHRWNLEHRRMRLTVENTAKDHQPVVAAGVSHRMFPGEKLHSDFTTAEVDEARKNPALRFNDDQLKLAGYHDTDARQIEPPAPPPADKPVTSGHAHGTRSKAKTGKR